MDGAEAGDYEIERKYLLRGMPRLPADARVLRIDQGWVPGKRIRERVRRIREGDQVRYYRTLKFGSGLKRFELEEETTAEVFRGLWRLTRGKRIRKVRYVVEDGGTWEIDRFIGMDWFFAEIELAAVDTPVTMPTWLAAVLDREVTGDVGYSNFSLAR